MVVLAARRRGRQVRPVVGHLGQPGGAVFGVVVSLLGPLVGAVVGDHLDDLQEEFVGQGEDVGDRATILEVNSIALLKSNRIFNRIFNSVFIVAWDTL